MLDGGDGVVVTHAALLLALSRIQHAFPTETSKLLDTLGDKDALALRTFLNTET